MADNRQLGVAEADSSGDFVAIFTADPSSEPQSLTLEAESAEGDVTRSEDVVVLLPAAAAAVGPETGAAPAVEEDGAEDVAEVPAETADAPSVDAPPEEIAAVAIVRRDGVDTMPLARPIGADPRDVALASISYGETGDVALSGFGTVGRAAARLCG